MLLLFCYVVIIYVVSTIYDASVVGGITAGVITGMSDGVIIYTVYLRSIVLL